jgi:hypothetical protein
MRTRCCSRPRSWPNRSEGTLVALLPLCGFRISETLAITAKDIEMRCAGREATVRLTRKDRAHLSRFHIDDAPLAARLDELQQQTPDDQAVFWPLDRFQASRVLAAIGRSAGLEPPPILTSYATPSAASCSPTAPTSARFNASPGTAASRPLSGTPTRCATSTPPSRHGCAESSAASTRPPVTRTPQHRP